MLIAVACTCAVKIAVLWHYAPAFQAVQVQLVISSVMRKFFEVTLIAFNWSDAAMERGW